MPRLTIRPTDDDDPGWTPERFAVLTGSMTHVDGEAYPIVEGRTDKDGAILIVDTGDDGPNPPPGTTIELGTVEG